MLNCQILFSLILHGLPGVDPEQKAAGCVIRGSKKAPVWKGADGGIGATRRTFLMILMIIVLLYQGCCKYPGQGILRVWARKEEMARMGVRQWKRL